MKHDPVRTEDTRGWLIRAARDLRSAEHGLRASPPLLEDVLFHCQQTVEKTFKALLAWHDTPFRRTHSLEEIGQQCLTIDPTLKELVNRATPLTEYAWKFRYPGELEEATEEEANEALQTGRTVYDAVLSRLPMEVHP